MRCIVQKIAFNLLVVFSAGMAFGQDKTAHIGVLAFRGVESAISEWQPLAAYLSESIDGWEFEIIPVTLVSAPERIKSDHLDFLITNPGHYVTLAASFGLSPIATRERFKGTESEGLMRYGTVIFARSDSGIGSLDGLKGRAVAAVSPEAFGGFQLAWQEFTLQGIDPFSDFDTLRFMGFPQDAIISAVKNGEVDAGVIRSGLLEFLALEGQFDLSDFVVLQDNSQFDYPYMVSGQLVPEWPFTAMPGVEKQLRESVALTLLGTQLGGSDLQLVLGHLWSAPLSYEGVRALTESYHSRNVRVEPWLYFLAGFAVFLLLIGSLFWRKSQYVTKAVLAESEVAEDAETQRSRALFDKLTKREREVLVLICAGHPSKEIAHKLGVTLKTIEYHRGNLLQKTKAGTTAHLVQLATRFDVT